ncbi:MAG: hypothetical protein JNN08_12425 [Bryobacterales bacterium]|nr:hypothetical protein [Bryobacterales bacterium]
MHRLQNCCYLIGILCGMSIMCAAQPIPPVVLTFDTDNMQWYARDVADYSLYATRKGPTAQVPAQNFNVWEGIGDVVALNGKPVKGYFRGTVMGLNTSTTYQPGFGIADVTRGQFAITTVELLETDGTPIGTIYAMGVIGGPPPPGSPSLQTNQNLAVVGGTGAYLGVTGSMGNVAGARPAPAPYRGNASVTEDPAERRNIGGGQTRRDIVMLIPRERPEVASDSSGPIIYHTDFRRVTAENPAVRGETLILKVSGLGPTRPNLSPEQTFPTDSNYIVNSPIEATVGGESVEVINKLGWPGTANLYRVDVRVPAGIPAGATSLVLRVAAIPGPAVVLPVR